MNLVNIENNIYPCSLWQLRQSYPQVSFPEDPSDEDLSPFGYANVHPTPQPIYNLRTECIEGPTALADSNGVYHESWTVRGATDAEISIYDYFNKPEPNWVAFSAMLLENSEIDAIFTSASQVSPLRTAALLSALQVAEQGDIARFGTVWSLWVNTINPPEALVQSIATAAETCHLPSSFISSILQPLGQ